jgi:hypothetical protein
LGQRADLFPLAPLVGIIFAGVGESAEAPWGQSPGKGVKGLGEAFYDPAFTLSRRLKFAAPYSLSYEYNPYLGVLGAQAPSTNVAAHVR